MSTSEDILLESLERVDECTMMLSFQEPTFFNFTRQQNRRNVDHSTLIIYPRQLWEKE